MRLMPADGVLFTSVRRRDFDELRSRLYNAFWETKEPFLPSPAEVGFVTVTLSATADASAGTPH